jgi:hypothetical protein
MIRYGLQTLHGLAAQADLQLIENLLPIAI